MNRSATVLRRGVAVAFIASALSGVAATLAMPTASAAPCTASGLASTSSGVMADAGAYLAGHPDADKVLTDAGTQSTGDAKAAVQSYFMAHPGEFLDLVQELRGTESSSYTESETPIFTCISASVERALGALDGESIVIETST